MSESNSIKWFSTITKYVILLLFSGILGYKIIITPLQLINMDFLALLSLILALFSVGLSAIFYFKATETSNAFYNDTFKYTKDIAELLVRIESGFGERLRHLDESYSRIQDRVMNGNNNHVMNSNNVEESNNIQAELDKQEKEFQEKLHERDEMIEQLATKAKLEGQKKDEFLLMLREKDQELLNSRQEVDALKGSKIRINNSHSSSSENEFQDVLAEYIKVRVLDLLDFSNRDKKITSAALADRWHQIRSELPRDFLEDMYKVGFIDSLRSYSLTRAGINFIQSIRTGQRI